MLVVFFLSALLLFNLTMRLLHIPLLPSPPPSTSWAVPASLKTLPPPPPPFLWLLLGLDLCNNWPWLKVFCVGMLELIKKRECSSFLFLSSFFLSLYNFAWIFHLYMSIGKSSKSIILNIFDK